MIAAMHAAYIPTFEGRRDIALEFFRPPFLLLDALFFFFHRHHPSSPPPPSFQPNAFCNDHFQLAYPVVAPPLRGIACLHPTSLGHPHLCRRHVLRPPT